MEGVAIANSKIKIKLQCPQGHWVFSEGINVGKLYKTTGIRVMSSQCVYDDNRLVRAFRLNEPQWELMKKRKNQRCLGCEKMNE
jgi:hypothetical protein